jgi:hypothetical protein
MSACLGKHGGVFPVFDVGQARQFIAAISGHEYEALFALALTTGMRPTEYLRCWAGDSMRLVRSRNGCT